MGINAQTHSALLSIAETRLSFFCGLTAQPADALFVLAANEDAAAVLQSNLLSLARANWSMPPDRGAAVVRFILESEELTTQWRRHAYPYHRHARRPRRAGPSACLHRAPKRYVFDTAACSRAATGAARGLRGLHGRFWPHRDLRPYFR